MYSVVLMAALATGTSSPAWLGHGCHGCHGACWGCYGGCFNCYGGWGCYGCYGCYGGGWGCHGCYGGGWGCYGGGCYGSGWGCYGGGCYGGGCYGGAYAGGCYGGGCYGGAYGGGCYGGSPYVSDYGQPIYQPGVPSDGTTPAESLPAPKQTTQQSEQLSPARLIVELPADAALYIDDQLMKTTSERRVFNTPKLEAGQTYYYILRAELERDGKKEVESKRVLVHAGEVVRTSFRQLDALATARVQTVAKP